MVRGVFDFNFGIFEMLNELTITLTEPPDISESNDNSISQNNDDQDDKENKTLKNQSIRESSHESEEDYYNNMKIAIDLSNLHIKKLTLISCNDCDIKIPTTTTSLSIATSHGCHITSSSLCFLDKFDIDKHSYCIYCTNIRYNHKVAVYNYNWRCMCIECDEYRALTDVPNDGVVLTRLYRNFDCRNDPTYHATELGTMFLSANTEHECNSWYCVTTQIKNIQHGAFKNWKLGRCVVIKAPLLKIPNECFTNSENIEEIVLPPTIQTLGKRAFYNCKSLKTINIPSNVKCLGNKLFCGCSSLSYIQLPSAITKIEKMCFKNCKNLKTVETQNKIVVLGEDCFAGCESLKLDFSFIIENSSPIELSKCHFKKCKWLTSFDIPSSVTHIGDDCFFGCTGLTEMTIPNTVISMGSRVFNECSNLKTLYVSDGIQMAKHWFNGLNNIETLHLPLCVDKLCDFRFFNMKMLKSVNLPNTLKTVGIGCFKGCVSLTTIIIPDSVSYIPTSCFEGCGLVKLVCKAKRFGNKCFYDCEDLEEVFTEADTAGDEAFMNCINLVKFINNGNFSVGKGCFKNCGKLKKFVGKIK
ncbi:hypothetical protein EIN_257340, partial [Entamoeba invadens IP1]